MTPLYFITPWWAKLIARGFLSLMYSHGCPAGAHDAFWHELVIANDTCHARKHYVCLALTQSPSACGFVWADQCTLTHPGPSECP